MNIELAQKISKLINDKESIEREIKSCDDMLKEMQAGNYNYISIIFQNSKTFFLHSKYFNDEDMLRLGEKAKALMVNNLTEIENIIKQTTIS